MYNGIGLQTPRGSGTNGYVQRNLAFVKSKKDKIDYKTEEELNKLDQGLNKQPNREILDHERKRKVELKCMEMQELMEEQGYSEKEVNNKVNMFRKMLMAKEGVSESSAVDKDEHGRPIARATHQLAEANQEKNERLKEAFGLTDYVEGSAFDPDRKAKEEAAKAAALAQKKYSVVNSSDEGEANNESSSASHKKKKKRRHESGSPERGKERRKKSRKHKKDRSHSKRHRKSKGHSKKRSVEKRRKRHQSSSESETEIESESDNMTVPSKAVTTQSEKLQEIPGPDKNINSESQTIAPLPQIPVPEIKSASPALEEKNLTTKQQDTLEGSREITNLVTNSLSKNEGTKVSVSREVNQPSEGRYSNPKGHTGSGRRSRSESSTSSSSRSRSRNRSRVKSHSPSWSPSPTRSSHRRSRSRSRSRHYSSGSDRSSGKDEKQRHHRRQSRSDRYSRSPSIRRRRGSPSHLDKRRITSRQTSPHSRSRYCRSHSRSYSRSSSSRSRSRSSCRRRRRNF